jgi:hypothetical protein
MIGEDLNARKSLYATRKNGFCARLDRRKARPEGGSCLQERDAAQTWSRFSSGLSGCGGSIPTLVGRDRRESRRIPTVGRDAGRPNLAFVFFSGNLVDDDGIGCCLFGDHGREHQDMIALFSQLEILDELFTVGKVLFS